MKKAIVSIPNVSVPPCSFQVRVFVCWLILFVCVARAAHAEWACVSVPDGECFRRVCSRAFELDTHQPTVNARHGNHSRDIVSRVCLPGWLVAMSTFRRERVSHVAWWWNIRSRSRRQHLRNVYGKCARMHGAARACLECTNNAARMWDTRSTFRVFATQNNCILPGSLRLPIRACHLNRMWLSTRFHVCCQICIVGVDSIAEQLHPIKMRKFATMWK